MARRKLINNITSENTTNNIPKIPDFLGRPLDYTPYINAGCYPGQKYFLVGSSYNVEINCTKAKMTRIFAIKNLFSKTNSITVAKALKNSEFYISLSHFERDWLGKLSSKTLLTPSFDASGIMLYDSFSVWRPLLRLV